MANGFRFPTIIGQPGTGTQPPGRFGRFADKFNSVLDRMGGPVNPNLSPDEQAFARKQQQMAMAGALLQASAPRPVGSGGGGFTPIGAAIQAGQQAGQNVANQAVNFRAANRIPGANSRFGSPQVLQSGRIGVLDRQSGRLIYSDSGEPVPPEDTASADLQLVTLPDGSQRLINMRRDISDDPRQTEDVVTSEEAVSGAAARAGAESAAQSQATADVSRVSEAPQEIMDIDNAIDLAEENLARITEGRLGTGFFRGMAPAVTTEEQLFEQFSGQAVIDAISQATFGQLSEGEREFLQTTVPSRRLSEEANQEIMERMIRILRKARRLEQERLEGASERLDRDVPAAPADNVIRFDAQGNRI